MSEKPKLYRVYLSEFGERDPRHVYRWADSRGDAEAEAPKWMRRLERDSEQYRYTIDAEEVEL